jgi:hypothetical protein
MAAPIIPAFKVVGNAILGSVASKLVDKTAHEFRRAVQSELQTVEARLGLILESIRDVENKVERLLAIPLKAALTHIRCGAYEKALDKLVEAEAADNRSALAKFWLGVMLSINGKKDLALEKVCESLYLNPFIMHLATPRAVAHLSLSKGGSAANRAALGGTWRKSVIYKDLLVTDFGEGTGCPRELDGRLY